MPDQFSAIGVLDVTNFVGRQISLKKSDLFDFAAKERRAGEIRIGKANP
jgi:hypothetical protein